MTESVNLLELCFRKPFVLEDHELVSVTNVSHLVSIISTG